MSLNIGTGGSALLSLLNWAGRLDGGGTGTVRGPCICAVELEIRKQVRRARNIRVRPGICTLNIANFFRPGKPPRRYQLLENGSTDAIVDPRENVAARA